MNKDLKILENIFFEKKLNKEAKKISNLIYKISTPIGKIEYPEDDYIHSIHLKEKAGDYIHNFKDVSQIFDIYVVPKTLKPKNPHFLIASKGLYFEAGNFDNFDNKIKKLLEHIDSDKQSYMYGKDEDEDETSETEFYKEYSLNFSNYLKEIIGSADSSSISLVYGITHPTAYVDFNSGPEWLAHDLIHIIESIPELKSDLRKFKRESYRVINGYYSESFSKKLTSLLKNITLGVEDWDFDGTIFAGIITNKFNLDELINDKLPPREAKSLIEAFKNMSFAIENMLKFLEGKIVFV